MSLLSLNSLGDKPYAPVKLFISEYINNLAIFSHIVFYSAYRIFP